jgi:hypothetical protein
MPLTKEIEFTIDRAIDAARRVAALERRSQEGKNDVKD